MLISIVNPKTGVVEPVLVSLGTSSDMFSFPEPSELSPREDYYIDCNTVYSFSCIAASGAPVASFLHKISGAGRLFHLREPLAVDLSFDDGLWFAESKRLSILAFGKTREQALISFQEDFSVLWAQIAQLPDQDLTPDAVAVKREMRNIVQVAAIGPSAP